MELLVLLQKIRNPILDYVCMFFTLCGQDAVLMLIFCTLYWCKDKTYAMRVGLSFISSALIVQTLKIICVVPRPWMLNSSIKPVEMAKKGASGYSFPSGHTQSATSIYATIAWNSSKSITKVGLFFLILLVAFSRLYLGVHTPLDVTSSLVISILVVVGINTLFDSAILDKVKRDTFFAIVLVIPLIIMAFATIRLLTHEVNVDNCMDIFKISGSCIGFAIGWYMDECFLGFDETKGSVQQKVAKTVSGLVILLVFKITLKLLCGDNPVSAFLIYGFIMFWTAFLYPFLLDTGVQKIIKNKK